MRVALAEDDDVFRSRLALALREDGHDVIELRNGRELEGYLEAAALLGTDADGPDLVLSDVRMPFRSALEVLEWLARQSRRPPVILFTAFADDSLLAAARRLGAWAVFSKPFDVDDLRTAVMLMAYGGGGPEP
jgi:DNA-binding response OmpR family regulator